jgi:hypothetical protein
MNGFDDLLNNSPADGQNGQQLSKEDYAARKKAEREDLFALSDVIALEVACDGGRFQQYLDVQSTFDRYSAVNALLIMAQKPEATRVADFDTWKGKGGSIRGGQSGIAILEPHTYTKEDGSPGVGYNVKKVFDISQVDTRKVKTPPPTPTRTERQLLQALVSKAPVKITGVETLPGNIGAQTNPETGEISVRKGMAFAETFSCVAQELAYADLTTGPDTPLDADFSAYSAAYLLCKKHGVDTAQFTFEDAPGVFDGIDAQEVKGELSQIRDVADDISGRMARLLEKAARNQEAR